MVRKKCFYLGWRDFRPLCFFYTFSLYLFFALLLLFCLFLFSFFFISLPFYPPPQQLASCADQNLSQCYKRKRIMNRWWAKFHCDSHNSGKDRNYLRFVHSHSCPIEITQRLAEWFGCPKQRNYFKSGISNITILPEISIYASLALVSSTIVMVDHPLSPIFFHAFRLNFVKWCNYKFAMR